MPQLPSDGLPHEIVGFYKGLNDQQDSVKRPAGTTTEALNVFDENVGDALRRRGRDFDFFEEGKPALIVSQLVWDDGSVSIITGGEDLGYSFTRPNPGIPDAAASVTPDFPLDPPKPRNLTAPQEPDLTSLMRSLSESSKFATGLDVSWPVQNYSFDAKNSKGKVVKTNVRTKTDIAYAIQNGLKLVEKNYGTVSPPSDGTKIPDDFYYADYFKSQSNIVSHLELIRNQYNIILLNFLKNNTIQGLTTAQVTNWQPSDIYSISTTIQNWKQVRNALVALINQRMLRFLVSGTFLGQMGEREITTFRNPPNCSLTQSETLSLRPLVPVGMQYNYNNGILTGTGSYSGGAANIEILIESQTDGGPTRGFIRECYGRFSFDLTGKTNILTSPVYLIMISQSNTGRTAKYFNANYSVGDVFSYSFLFGETATPGTVYTSTILPVATMDISLSFQDGCPVSPAAGDTDYCDFAVVFLTRSPKFTAEVVDS